MSRTLKTYAKEMEHYDDLSHEMEEELDYKRDCLENGKAPEITKIDITKCITAVPTMSELLWSLRSNVDENKFLRQVDLEPLSKLHAVPPLLYVANLNAEHEANRLPTPSAVGGEEKEAGKKS